MKFIIAAAIGAVIIAGCGGSDHGASRVNTGKAESQIKPALQSQLRKLLDDSSVVVDSVDCIANSDQQGSCIAKLHDSSGNLEDANMTQVSIDLSIDPHSGAAIWKVAQ